MSWVEKCAVLVYRTGREGILARRVRPVRR